ncbi:hypothetical protein SEVIR_3G319345v4 [Setaria viridis]
MPARPRWLSGRHPPGARGSPCHASTPPEGCCSHTPPYFVAHVMANRDAGAAIDGSFLPPSQALSSCGHQDLHGGSPLPRICGLHRGSGGLARRNRDGSTGRCHPVQLAVRLSTP